MFSMLRKISPFAWFALPLVLIPEVAYAVLAPSSGPLFAICYAAAGAFTLLWILRHVTFARPDRRSATISFSFKARGTAARIFAAFVVSTEVFLMLSFSDVLGAAHYSKFNLIPCGISAIILWAFAMGVDKLWNQSIVVS